MTSFTLLLWIALGIALQLAIHLGIGLRRHWTDYRALRLRADGLDSPTSHSPAASGQPPVAAWPGYRTFRVVRKVYEDAGQSVCSFYLAAEDGRPLPPFLPGQFLTVRLDVPAATGGTEQIIRCYSLSDAPNPDCYRVTIKRALSPAGCDVAPGRSSGFFHDHIAVGSLLQVRSPAGHFHTDRGDSPLVLIGGGIGITPLLSIANGCLGEQPGREVWLFYGLRNSRDMVMKSRLEALAARHPNFRLRICFSDPLADDVAVRDYQHRTRIDVNVLRMQLPLKPYHFYICGPAPMMESLVPALEDWGVPDSRIHFEAFGPASIKRRAVQSPVAPADTSAGDAGDSRIAVTFARTGRQLPWTPEAGNLLDFAEANGIAVESGCRAGGCGSCQTAIRSGEVTYRQSPEYDPEPGTCLLCVCAPRTGVTLEA